MKEKMNLDKPSFFQVLDKDNCILIRIVKKGKFCEITSEGLSGRVWDPFDPFPYQNFEISLCCSDQENKLKLYLWLCWLRNKWNFKQLLGSNNVAKNNMALCGLQLFWPHSFKLFLKVKRTIEQPMTEDT